jgi:hypothetical protein
MLTVLGMLTVRVEMSDPRRTIPMKYLELSRLAAVYPGANFPVSVRPS